MTGFAAAALTVTILLTSVWVTVSLRVTRLRASEQFKIMLISSTSRAAEQTNQNLRNQP